MDIKTLVTMPTLVYKAALAEIDGERYVRQMAQPPAYWPPGHGHWPSEFARVLIERVERNELTWADAKKTALWWSEHA